MNHDARWMSRDTRMNESWPVYEYSWIKVQQQRWMWRNCLIRIHVGKLIRIHVCDMTHLIRIHVCDMTHLIRIHVCDMTHLIRIHVCDMTHLIRIHVCDMTHLSDTHSSNWGILHLRRSHVSHMNESCHTHEWVMSHTWMRNVTCMRNCLIGIHKNKACHAPQ